MNVRTICLAVLFCGDKSGYDIRKSSTEGPFSFFVEASYGSIYPALSRLEADKLVIGRHETQEGKPARKIYSITDAGREAFLSELILPHRPDIFRSEFLLISIFARMIGPDAIEAAIERQISQLEQEIMSINSCDEMNQEGALNCPAQDSEEQFEDVALWAQNYGRYCVQASIDYLRKHGVELVEIARQSVLPQNLNQAGLE
ncbi:PadR family transcriptional regulator [Cohaesibacter celericrescens]|uniref:PadR family transcriptional regulator n=1 Tax=Cohaesibacter celericrescens TaxID=2067669 RepID=A0A2N5XQF3_9HYPH|nr:PadR family transcriptional regulator [Cohaesibacter celericrescens]PLW76751.1 PadR family transcriptional regulator [Cohaesibacter celericrescens]